LDGSLFGVRVNILDVAARPFKQKTRIDPTPLTACPG
jgi:hypothetical protein